MSSSSGRLPIAPEMGPALRNRTEEDGEGKARESLLPKSLTCNAVQPARSEQYCSFAYSALASFRITPGGLTVSAELARLPRIDTVARLFNSHARIIREYSSSTEIR